MSADEHLEHECLGNRSSGHQTHELEPNSEQMVGHQDLVNRRVVAGDGVVRACECSPSNGEEVISLHCHIGMKSGVEEAVIASHTVQRRQEDADSKMLACKCDLPATHRAQPCRRLTPKAPGVHEGSSVWKDQTTLPEHVVSMTPCVDLGFPQLGHVRNRFACCSLALRRHLHRDWYSAELEKAREQDFVGFVHGHVERR
mmetsp:Transcript_34599/g.111721  ORF Transcript_34599/g.111721 Transcript_34599/m.111721 type:complete len:200 (+) Transcript_34599:857-1456(+)